MASPHVASPISPSATRFTSLDALRGFDMFWIMGADSLGRALAQMDGGPVFKHVAEQMEHVSWEGFHFYDLIFPLFVFLAGVAIAFSVEKAVEQHGISGALARIWKRTALLYLLGLVYYGGLKGTVADIRFVGVLHRIAISYGVAATLFVFLKPRGLFVTFIGILTLYWALMSFVPVPGVGAGNFAEGRNLANWIDFHYLPGRKWDGNHDPEGLLSNLPAIGTCLMGVLAGVFLRRTDLSPVRRAQTLAFCGAASLALGYLWSLQFPIIKKLWTSSYVLVAGGWSLLLLSFFYWVVDICGWKRWCQPFVWVGANSILIYLAGEFVNFEQLAQRFVGGSIQKSFSPGMGELLVSIVAMLLCFALARFLYRRQVFVRF